MACSRKGKYNLPTQCSFCRFWMIQASWLIFAWQAWERLEKAEHERELALRNELIRQEKLEMLAARFDRKAAMRETWLSENQRLVSQVN